MKVKDGDLTVIVDFAAGAAASRAGNRYGAV